MTRHLDGLVPLSPEPRETLRWSRPARRTDVHLLEGVRGPVAQLELDGERGRALTLAAAWRLEPDGHGRVRFIDGTTGTVGLHLGGATWRGTRVATTVEGERYLWEPADWLRRSWRFRRNGAIVVEFRSERAFCQDRSVVVTGSAPTQPRVLALLAMAGRYAGLRSRADSDVVASVGGWTAGG